MRTHRVKTRNNFIKQKLTVFVTKIVVLDCIIFVYSLVMKCNMSSVIKTSAADYLCLTRHSSTLHYQIPSILN